jgi:hypothetical protein
MISRRKLISGAAALATAAMLPSNPAGAISGIIPGAIRWDAWYGSTPGSSESGVNGAVDISLGPAQWQPRAPWFASPVSAYLNSINGGTQATIDEEINLAAQAGLKYWAYCWYGQQTPDSSMQIAWHLHQSSSVASRMNWCLLLQFTRTGTWAASIPTYVGYFQQANYQKVLGGRPLLYVFIDNLTGLNAWGGSWANVQAGFKALRSATTAPGLATPYIVILYGWPPTAASYATQTGADAISEYGAGLTSGIAEPWASAEPGMEAYWASEAAAGMPIVVPCQTGADTRPRSDHPWLGGKPHFGESVYVVPPTPAQVAAHLQNAINYIAANPTVCPSKAMLIYSWDECDEGGNALIPTLGDPPVNTDAGQPLLTSNLLAAIGPVLRAAA